MSKHHCYHLVLTKQDRHAIDFVGDRYKHGRDLFKLLNKADWKIAELGVPFTAESKDLIEGYKVHDLDDIEWYGDYDIMFFINESLAWEIQELIESEVKANNSYQNMALFSEALQCKLLEFCDRII